jgi:hypothetical protein
VHVHLDREVERRHVRRQRDRHQALRLGRPLLHLRAVTQTHWITFIYLPVIPLGKYRVKKVTPSRFLSRKLAA